MQAAFRVKVMKFPSKTAAKKEERQAVGAA